MLTGYTKVLFGICLFMMVVTRISRVSLTLVSSAVGLMALVLGYDSYGFVIGVVLGIWIRSVRCVA